ncbi:MAG: hypothetical protein ABI969_18360, partial [bacterium]
IARAESVRRVNGKARTADTALYEPRPIAAFVAMGGCTQFSRFRLSDDIRPLMLRMNATRATRCALLSVSVLAACSHATEPLMIGAVGMLKDGDDSEDNLRGIRIAIDQANESGGIRGRRIDLRILKDSGRG